MRDLVAELQVSVVEARGQEIDMTRELEDLRFVLGEVKGAFEGERRLCHKL